ncbi:hypothetical protein [Variovorax saccharolyticus]|uniref:hypothetical protein n=1 Tax=Variovorax saccharolyticus TaxID=3053516 RepID=UPI002576974B|nr:hypothetical protein [Variovorax sp. J31P216]MDM0030279.1 hypothetical protein [Variovorax sp. J31P216]
MNWVGPYTPKTNGKAERFVQTSLRDWASARPYEGIVTFGRDDPWQRCHRTHVREGQVLQSKRRFAEAIVNGCYRQPPTFDRPKANSFNQV